MLELNTIYFDTKNKYDILYKEMNIETSAKNNVVVIKLILFVMFISSISLVGLFVSDIYFSIWVCSLMENHGIRIADRKWVLLAKMGLYCV